MSAEHEKIQARFEQFCRALLSADIEAFESLWMPETEADRALFVRNSKKLRAGEHQLQARRIVQVGGNAELFFEIVDAHGTSVDEALLSFGLDGDKWWLVGL